MKCFATNLNAIEQRLDCHYYRPEFVELESRVAKLTDKKLGDYIISIAGGATPDKNEAERYYTDSENGVPFLRVQNVTPGGLDFENLVFINQETHNSMLKRSQVKEHYLITKITGVGRMAVSSVAPPNFEGNINQHLVAIKTEGPEVSRTLAAFLNSDIGERLASRRSTGGTRPALDYEALKTIPIVFEPHIVNIMESAYELKRKKQREAQELLDSIDECVLGELGIVASQGDSRCCFVVWAKELEGKRVDPKAYTSKPKAILESISKSKYPIRTLRELVAEQIAGYWGETPGLTETGQQYILCSVIRNTDFDNDFNLNLVDVARRLLPIETYERIKLKAGDLLLEKSGGSPAQPVGRIALITNEQDGYAFSNFVQLLRIHKNECLPEYLFTYLRTIYRLGYMEYIQNQTTGIRNLILDEFMSISVPIPLDLTIQEKIASEAMKKVQKAKNLRQEIIDSIEKAKTEVERLILSK